MSTEASTPPSASTDNGKTIAIISYITLIGWIIALIMHNGNKTKLGAFHLRQMLGFMIVGVAIQIAFIIIGIILGVLGIKILFTLFGLVSLVVWIGMLVLWVLGLIAAVKGEEKPMPCIGAMIQEKLAKVFA